MLCINKPKSFAIVSFREPNVQKKPNTVVANVKMQLIELFCQQTSAIAVQLFWVIQMTIDWVDQQKPVIVAINFSARKK